MVSGLSRIDEDSAWADGPVETSERGHTYINPLRTVVAYMHQGNKYFTVRKQIIITSPTFTL